MPYIPQVTRTEPWHAAGSPNHCLTTRWHHSPPATHHHEVSVTRYLRRVSECSLILMPQVVPQRNPPRCHDLTPPAKTECGFMKENNESHRKKTKNISHARLQFLVAGICTCNRFGGARKHFHAEKESCKNQHIPR